MKRKAIGLVFCMLVAFSPKLSFGGNETSLLHQKMLVLIKHGHPNPYKVTLDILNSKRFSDYDKEQLKDAMDAVQRGDLAKLTEVRSSTKWEMVYDGNRRFFWATMVRYAIKRLQFRSRDKFNNWWYRLGGRQSAEYLLPDYYLHTNYKAIYFPDEIENNTAKKRRDT